MADSASASPDLAIRLQPPVLGLGCCDWLASLASDATERKRFGSGGEIPIIPRSQGPPRGGCALGAPFTALSASLRLFDSLKVSVSNPNIRLVLEGLPSAKRQSTKQN